MNSVSVEWSNHNKVLIENQWKLFVNKCFPEHVLTCEDKVINVHFAILCALCENFSSDKFITLKSETEPGSSESKIRFAINGVSSEILECFLEFLYRGKCILPADDFKTFLVLVLQVQVRDLDKIKVEFFDCKDGTGHSEVKQSMEVNHVDETCEKKQVDCQQDDSFLNDYLASFSAYSEEDWNEINLDNFLFALVKEKSLTNKSLEECVISSTTMDPLTDLEILDLSQEESPKIFHVNDILRCCSCLMKEYQQKFTVTFLKPDSKLERQIAPDDCDICSIKSSNISLTAEKMKPIGKPDFFVSSYVSRITRSDDIVFLGSYGTDTFSSEVSNFCSETKPEESNFCLEFKSKVDNCKCKFCKFLANSEHLLACHLTSVHRNIALQVSNESSDELVKPKRNATSSRSALCKSEEISENKEVNKLEIMQSPDKDSSYKKRKYIKRERFFCAKCGYNSYSNFEIKCHRMQHVKQAPFKCEDCEGEFARRIALIQHIASAHSQLNDFSKCSLCNFRTPWRIRMNRHVRCSHSARCDLCFKYFKTNKSLEIHKGKFHGKMESESPDNTVSGYLEEHFDISEPEKQFKNCTVTLQTISKTPISHQTVGKANVVIPTQPKIDPIKVSSLRLKRFTCPKCDFKSKKPKKVLRHVAESHFDSP